MMDVESSFARLARSLDAGSRSAVLKTNRRLAFARDDGFD
jgi:hypothetical protein